MHEALKTSDKKKKIRLASCFGRLVSVGVEENRRVMKKENLLEKIF